MSSSKLIICAIVGLTIGNIACSNPDAQKPKVYHIIGQDKVSVKDTIDPSEPPPPPLPFYGEINLILYGKSDVYLHRVAPSIFVDHDFEDRPMEVVLTKWDLRKIERSELPQFLATEYKSVSPEKSRHYTTGIKSASDTITNEAFSEIKLFFGGIKFDQYFIRKWTDQEKQAIESIKRN
jgi:hypothetical protein